MTAPFTERRWVISGPGTAVSCEVKYDTEIESWHAEGSGFHGTGESEAAAAMACFTAWLTQSRGWYAPQTGD